MKKIILALMMLMSLQSCYTIYHEASYVIDFREYVNNGFMISPTDTGFDYTPIAQLEVNYYLGQKVIDGDTKDLKKGSDGNYFPTSKRLMDKVVDKAKSLGGDGIVCFNIKYYPPTKSSQAYYQATGVAVKVNK